MDSEKSLPKRLIHSIIVKSNDLDEFREDSTTSEIENIIDMCIPIFNNEPTVLNLDSDIHIVGDIHGNVIDLLRFFEIAGYPPKSKFLFLGDYVDRGKNSIEVLTLLLSLKILYPNHIYMIRGNHETKKVSMNYGFFAEIQSSYRLTLFGNFVRLFYKLPLAAIISNSILCVHGGISKSMEYISDLSSLPKPTEIYADTIPCDVLWSDPCATSCGFIASDRGLGYLFNEAVLSQFLKRNKLTRLVRSHEYCNGFNYPFKGSDICTTVFSNTNYCDKANSAAIIYVNPNLTFAYHIIEQLPDNSTDSLRFTLPELLITMPQKSLNDFNQFENDACESPSSSPIALKLL